MLKVKILFISILLLFLSSSSLEERIPQAPSIQKVEAKQMDERAQILAEYLASYNSPLENQAQNFVDAADQYGVDWKLVPAISGVESTFGKRSYGFNAWGWGIYGYQALGFRTWRDGIYTVTEGLKTNYIDRGLTEPYAMNRAYAASPTWGWRVSYFMDDLEQFAQKKQPSSKPANNFAKTAVSSAQLAVN